MMFNKHISIPNNKIRKGSMVWFFHQTFCKKALHNFVNQPVVQSLVNPRLPGLLPRLSRRRRTAALPPLPQARSACGRPAGGVRELGRCRRPGARAGGRWMAACGRGWPAACGSSGGSRRARRGRRRADVNDGVAGARAAGRFHVGAGGCAGTDGAPIPSPPQTSRLRWRVIGRQGGSRRVVMNGAGRGRRPSIPISSSMCWVRLVGVYSRRPVRRCTEHTKVLLPAEAAAKVDVVLCSPLCGQ
jgi:hypothetical protein